MHGLELLGVQSFCDRTISGSHSHVAFSVRSLYISTWTASSPVLPLVAGRRSLQAADLKPSRERTKFQSPLVPRVSSTWSWSGLPVAVAWGTGSSSEISSANYSARAFGASGRCGFLFPFKCIAHCRYSGWGLGDAGKWQPFGDTLGWRRQLIRVWRCFLLS